MSGRPTTLSNDTGSVTLSSSSPTYIDGEGHTDFYAEHTFSVPAGADNLNGNITWNAQHIGGVAFETLFDPQGNVAAYSLIGTNQSGFGHVEVHNPMAGTWTAVIFTVSNAPYFGTGPVLLPDRAEPHRPVRSRRRRRTLKPGQTRRFTVKVTAGQAGDEALKLHLGTGSGNDGSIPIILRSLVPLVLERRLVQRHADRRRRHRSTPARSSPTSSTCRANKPSLNVGVQLADTNYGLKGS